MLNVFYNKLWYLKLEIYCKIKQYSFHTECPVFNSVKKEVTVHFKHEAKAHLLEDSVDEGIFKYDFNLFYNAPPWTFYRTTDFGTLL
jgi:hypothetical protein